MLQLPQLWNRDSDSEPVSGAVSVFESDWVTGTRKSHKYTNCRHCRGERGSSAVGAEGMPRRTSARTFRQVRSGGRCKYFLACPRYPPVGSRPLVGSGFSARPGANRQEAGSRLGCSIRVSRLQCQCGPERVQPLHSHRVAAGMIVPSEFLPTRSAPRL